MKGIFARRRRPDRNQELTELGLEAERGQVLLEESREIVVVLDDRDRVLAASRRARESIEGLVEGAPFPERLLRSDRDGAPLRVAYDLAGRRETLLYLFEPGDLAAYEELRAGFTAAVSHELRTPLARLLSLLETIALPGANGEELIELARAEVLRMGELIDDVLFLSELESGREVVSLGATPALPVLERVAQKLDARAQRAGVAVTISCPASLKLPLRHRMLEVLATNLVENALRYAGPGARLTLSGSRVGDRLLLSAVDDGVGVREEELPRLFERFYRADRARASRGTGLGLAIVKHIAVAAGGDVEAALGPAGGLAIHCSFPSA